MTPETLEALKGSIEKWRKIVEEDGEDLGANNCPLCRMFRCSVYIGYGRHKTICDGCPVKEHTGQHGCCDTPYDDWVNPEGLSKEEEEAARAMLAFLQSLLPPEEAKEP